MVAARPIRRGVFLGAVACLLLLGARPAWACFSRADYMASLAKRMKEYEEQDDEEWALRRSQAVSSRDRVAGSDRLAMLGTVKAREGLKALLGDPDPVVRRVAAEHLLKGDALTRSAAARHRYLKVHKAEIAARQLESKLAEGRESERFMLTQKLIALGWPAWCELLCMSESDKSHVNASASYAMQEIERCHRNVAPLWAQEIRAKLAEGVSFEFVNTPFSECIRFLSMLKMVPIELPEGLPGLETPIDLKVTDMSLALSLHWMGRLAELEYDLEPRCIRFRQPMFACGSSPYYVDVRDLQDAGMRPDWKKLIAEDVMPNTSWFDVPELGTGFTDHDGVLEIWVPSCSMHRPNPGWGKLQPILDYVLRQRLRLGLKGPVWAELRKWR